LPRTAMTDRLRSDGRLPEGCYWDRCTYYDAIFEPKGMTKGELEKGVAALHEVLLSPEVNAQRRSNFKGMLRKLKRQGLSRWHDSDLDKVAQHEMSLL